MPARSIEPFKARAALGLVWAALIAAAVVFVGLGFGGPGKAVYSERAAISRQTSILEHHTAHAVSEVRVGVSSQRLAKRSAGPVAILASWPLADYGAADGVVPTYGYGGAMVPARVSNHPRDPPAI